jgi:hypothetical protein
VLPLISIRGGEETTITRLGINSTRNNEPDIIGKYDVTIISASCALNLYVISNWARSK